MPLHCVFPCEQDVVNPNPTVPLVGRAGSMVAHGFSDEFIIINHAQMTHVGTVGGGPPDPTLTRVAQLLDSTAAFRQDWAVSFQGLQEGMYSLDLSVQIWGSGLTLKSFPVQIGKLSYEAVVSILHPLEAAIVDDRHFVSFGTMMGVSVLDHVELRQGAERLRLPIQYPQAGLWMARWINVPASHQTVPVVLAAKPPGGSEVVRNITIRRLVARSA